MRHYLWIGIGTLIFMGLFFMTLTFQKKNEVVASHRLLLQPAPMHVFGHPEFESSTPKNQLTGFKLVVFSASWCMHCEEVLSRLQPLSLPVWLVLYHDNAQLSNIQKERADKIFRDTTQLIAPYWGIRGVPEIFLIDPNDRLIFHKAGKLYEDDIITIRKKSDPRYAH